MVKRKKKSKTPPALEHYELLLTAEITAYLKKIYKAMRPKTRLAPVRFDRSHLSFMRAGLSATKVYEFRPSSREDAARGDVGDVTVITRCLKDAGLRKQTALFIAAEWYVYHAFANHKDPKYYRSIKGQNQYWDVIKKLFGKSGSLDLREQAMRYVIGELDEHKLAQYQPKNWYINITKLKKHDPEMAAVLGSSEKTFKKVLSQQRMTFTPEMLVREDTLLRKELEDIQHLTELLKEHRQKNHTKEFRQLMKIHIENLTLFEDVIKKILANIQDWESVDRQEHRMLSKKIVSMQEIHRLLKQEAAADRTDINKVQILFRHFEKEKINILKDLEIFERESARPGFKKR